MGGPTKQTSDTTSSQQSNPWAPTIPGLNDIISQITGQIPSSPVNSTEQGALNTLQSNAAAGNPYAPAIQDLATNLLNGGGANNQAGTINNAYGGLQGSLTPVANAPLDPTQTPGITDALNTVRGDVTNSVNGLFAGAGRDLSGLNVQNLARGISQGEAPILLDQYNKNVANRTNAASNLFTGGVTTGGTLAGLNQQSLANQLQGVGTSSDALQARDSGANQVLNIQNLVRSLPLQTLSLYGDPLAKLATLGGQVSGQSHSESSTQVPVGQQILGGALGGVGLLGQLGGFGPTGWLYGKSGGGLLNGIFGGR